MVTKLPGRASHPEKEKNCDLRSFPYQQGFPGVGEASDRGRTPRCNPLSSGFSCGALAHEDALWATLAPWSQGRREKGGIRVTASSWMEPWPGQVSLLTPTALPLPSPLTAGGEVLISPGPDTRQTLNEWPLFLSGGVVGPACSECPQEPGSPGEGKRTEQWEHTVLLRKK